MTNPGQASTHKSIIRSLTEAHMISHIIEMTIKRTISTFDTRAMLLSLQTGLSFVRA